MQKNVFTFYTIFFLYSFIIVFVCYGDDYETPLIRTLRKRTSVNDCNAQQITLIRLYSGGLYNCGRGCPRVSACIISQ